MTWQALDDAALQRLLDSGSLTVRGHVLTPDDVHLRYCADGDANSRYEAHADNDVRIQGQ